MNDDLHPDPTDTELLASALIDGALPADEAGSAQASPEVAALAEQFTAVRTVLAVVSELPALPALDEREGDEVTVDLLLDVVGGDA